jgi:hypothetical protein
MGLFEDYKSKNGETSVKKLVTVEFVLKNIDNNNNSDIVLADNTESSSLPITGPITTILQTIRNCLKWLSNNKAASSYTHVISNTINLQTTLDDKATSGHTHDDRYYTETEVDTKLNGKSNTDHTHSYLNSIAAEHSDVGINSYGKGTLNDVSLSINGNTITLNRNYSGGNCYGDHCYSNECHSDYCYSAGC